MTTVYEKSLDLMDDHFGAISDEDFMRDYLSIEKHQGPLVNDFLSEFNFLSGKEVGITVAETLSLFNLDCFISGQVEYNDSILQETVLVERKEVASFSFDLAYVANDNCYCDLGLVA